MITQHVHLEYFSKIAQEIKQYFINDPNLVAIQIVGSVSRGLADEYSDIEIIITWKSAITDDQRKEWIKQIGGNLLFFFPYDEEEWTESFMYKDVKIDLSHFITSTIENHITDVTENFDISLSKHSILSSIYDGITLYGDEVVQEWKKKIANYPEKLAEKCIRVNTSFMSWSMREALLKRNDVIALNEMVHEYSKEILMLLFAINKKYLMNYNFKWLSYQINSLQIKPVDLEVRLRRVFLKQDDTALSELDSLIHETFELVEKYYPSLDLSEEKKFLNFKRKSISIPA